MEKTKKVKGLFSCLLCKHDYIYLGKLTRIKYTFSGDRYYQAIEMYQCNKCGKMKQRVAEWK